MASRFIFPTFCASAAVLLAAGIGQSSPGPALYPIWWYQDLNLFNLRDIRARFAQSFTPRQQRFLLEELARYGDNSSAIPRNCQSLLQEEESFNDPESSGWWYRHTDTWGELGMNCNLLTYLRHARPARISYLHDTSWNQDISTLLPAGVAWTNNDSMVEEAVEADKRHETLEIFRLASTWTADASTLEEQDPGDPPYGAFYTIAAKGDFNRDGIEDWIIETTGALHRTGDRNYHLFLVTKRSHSGKIETIKRLF